MTDITPAQKSALLKLEGFKEIQKQFAKEQKQAGAGKKRMRGKGFWESVGNWFSQAGKDINQFLKDTKLVSNVAAYALPILGAMGGALLTVNPLGATAGGIAGKSAADYIKSQGYGATHRMPDGSIMKGKIHGGMHGKGIFPLAINMPNQRMRGIAPKSKMRGGGLLENVFSTVAPLAAVTISNAQSKLSNLKKMTGRGYGTTMNTVGVNGVPQRTSAPAHSGIVRNIGGKGMHTKAAKMKGMGGTEYNTVSSEFGNVKF